MSFRASDVKHFVIIIIIKKIKKKWEKACGLKPHIASIWIRPCIEHDVK